MSMLVIAPATDEMGEYGFVASVGEHLAHGATAGAALDQLLARLPVAATEGFVVLPRWQPNEFFSADQLAQLQTLRARWRAAQERGERLPPEEQARYDALLEAEQEAGLARTEALADLLGR